MFQRKDTGSGKHWTGLSDEELLETELTTDDPERLPGLVTILPSGFEDSYVEYAYDLPILAERNLSAFTVTIGTSPASLCVETSSDG
jgi:hypothetical protein